MDDERVPDVLPRGDRSPDDDPPDDDPPEWLEPEDLTDEELGVDRPLAPVHVAAARRRARERWRYLADDPLPEPEPVTCATVGTLVRALRWRTGTSQRELAVAGGLAPSSVVRLESAAGSDPRLSTLVGLVQASGLRLVVVDDEGTQLTVPFEQTGYRDGADRRLPAHLQSVDPRFTPWWGHDRYRSHGRPLRPPVRASRRRRPGT